ncbi:SubName: Full=Uncharacterized protein {ECO:0000313/EMBL:CCA72016.1} [Serendipita indica DSM 11827]|nr:SubName: Full=Uncharacterized protein {ECO:0000313/EMBL:CCA72016.1} [Serendipita indica DSM 11827]
MESLEDSVQWTDIVAMMCREGHAEGITREQIEHALKILPVHPAMIRAVKRLKASEDPKATFFCLSNANQVFIDTILKDKKLDTLFDRITTNPAEWTDDGLLVVRRKVDPNGPQHSCKVGCSPNMCKGEELTAFLAEHEEYDKVVYIGDGSNDFCPVVRLRKQDMVLARRDRGLQRRIDRDGEKAGLQCEVVWWEGAWEVEEQFAKL